MGRSILLLPKHQRWEDIPLLGLASPRPLFYLAKYELFRFPLIGRTVAALGGLPLNRERPVASRATLKQMIHLLDHQQAVVIFPEGTYYPARMGPERTGVLRYLLKRRRLPIVPVGIRYEASAVRRQVWVNFGKPVLLEETHTRGLKIASVMRAIAELSGIQ